MNFSKKAFFLFTLLATFGCHTLPKQTPEHLMIDFHLGHGGIPRPDSVNSYDIRFVPQEPSGLSSLEYWIGENKNTLEFSVGAGELDNLYQEFMKVKFDQISVSKRPVMMDDVGGHTLTIRWLDQKGQNQVLSKRIDGGQWIKDQQQSQEFEGLIMKLETLAREKIQATQLKNIRLEQPPQNPLAMVTEMSINVGTPLEEKMTQPLTHETTLHLPLGKSEIHFITTANSEKHYHNQVVDITNDTSCLQLTMGEDKPMLVPCKSSVPQ